MQRPNWTSAANSGVSKGAQSVPEAQSPGVPGRHHLKHVLPVEQKWPSAQSSCVSHTAPAVPFGFVVGPRQSLAPVSLAMHATPDPHASNFASSSCGLIGLHVREHANAFGSGPLSPVMGRHMALCPGHELAADSQYGLQALPMQS
jgi:hypothetical protein